MEIDAYVETIVASIVIEILSVAILKYKYRRDVDSKISSTFWRARPLARASFFILSVF